MTVYRRPSPAIGTVGAKLSILGAIAAALIVSGCTSGTDAELDLAMPGYADQLAAQSASPAGSIDGATDPLAAATTPAPPDAAAMAKAAGLPAGQTQTATETGVAPAVPLPQSVAAVPATSSAPGQTAASLGFAAAPTAPGAPPTTLEEKAALLTRQREQQQQATAGPAPEAGKATPARADAKPQLPGQVMENASPEAALALASPEPTQKKGFFGGLFAAKPQQAASTAPQQVASAAPVAKPLVPKGPATPLIDVKVEPTEILAMASAAPPMRRTAGDGWGENLPGVRKTALFEITRKSGLDDDSDVDLHEDEGAGVVQVASAAGLARLAPNGLLKQTDSVDTACLKPSLVRMLKQVESRFGKKMVITSGYRSAERNRRARGARNSQHMYCAAADVQIPGVTKWELAQYVRTMPGRGGVGTYCHTESVHIDIGPERDWNWRCRGRK